MQTYLCRYTSVFLINLLIFSLQLLIVRHQLSNLLVSIFDSSIHTRHLSQMIFNNNIYLMSLNFNVISLTPQLGNIFSIYLYLLPTSTHILLILIFLPLFLLLQQSIFTLIIMNLITQSYIFMLFISQLVELLLQSSYHRVSLDRVR